MYTKTAVTDDLNDPWPNGYAAADDYAAGVDYAAAGVGSRSPTSRKPSGKTDTATCGYGWGDDLDYGAAWYLFLLASLIQVGLGLGLCCAACYTKSDPAADADADADADTGANANANGGRDGAAAGTRIADLHRGAQLSATSFV